MNLRRYLPEIVRIKGRSYFSAAWVDLTDAAKGKPRPALVPPARLDTNGNGDYVGVGEGWARRFREHGMRADSDVLELGCGTGRIARALIAHSGQYHGYDVLKSAIDWAARAFEQYPRLSFAHLDVFNDLYNPGGKPIDEGFAVRCPPKDFVYATSLFSHLDPEISKIYLRAIHDTLKPGGVFVSTWYLFGPDTLTRPNLRYNLPHDFGFFRRQTLANPALVVAYDERWLREAFAGFSNVEILEGQWRGGSYAGQDVVIARK